MTKDSKRKIGKVFFALCLCFAFLTLSRGFSGAVFIVAAAYPIADVKQPADGNRDYVYKALQEVDAYLSGENGIGDGIDPINIIESWDWINNRVIEILDRLIDEGYGYPEVWYKRGIAYYRLASYEDSLDSFEQALEGAPGYVEALCGKGHALSLIGSDEEASIAWKEVEALGPEYSKDWCIKNTSSNFYNQIVGNAETKRKAEDGLLDAVNTIIDIDPGNVSLLNSLGAILFYLGRYSEAIETVDESLRLDPDNVQALLLKGNILEISDHHEGALGVYDKIILIKPDSIEAWFCKARIFAFANDRERAIDSLSRVINNELELDEYATGRRLIFYHADVFLKIVRVLIEDVQQYPDDEYRFALLARAYEAKGDRKQAVYYYRFFSEATRNAKWKEWAEKRIRSIDEPPASRMRPPDHMQIPLIDFLMARAAMLQQDGRYSEAIETYYIFFGLLEANGNYPSFCLTDFPFSKEDRKYNCPFLNESIEAYTNIAEFMLMAGDYSGAYEKFKFILDFDPGNAVAMAGVDKSVTRIREFNDNFLPKDFDRKERSGYTKCLAALVEIRDAMEELRLTTSIIQPTCKNNSGNIIGCLAEIVSGETASIEDFDKFVGQSCAPWNAEPGEEWASFKYIVVTSNTGYRIHGRSLDKNNACDICVTESGYSPGSEEECLSGEVVVCP